MENVSLSCIESKVENNCSMYSRFELQPFERGQGLTVANALRRTLLSELSGLAIICVEINGVSHEYSNIKGVRESVLDILLNLKQINFFSNEKYDQPYVGFLKVQGPRVVKARDLKLPSFLQCVDPDQHIVTLSDNGKIEMKCMICKGKNFLVQTSFELIEKTFYEHFQFTKKSIGPISLSSNLKEKPAALENDFKLKNHKTKINRDFFQKEDILSEVNFTKFEENLIQYKKKTRPSRTFYNSAQTLSNSLKHKLKLRKKTSTNILLIDAVFMPITKVNFSIQNIDYFSKVKDSTIENKLTKNHLQEKIILEIWTNGSIKPHEAIHEAAQELVTKFVPFQKIYSHKKSNFFIEPTILHTPISDISLSTKENQDSSFKLKKESNSTKLRTNTSFTTTLNKSYQPWETKLKTYPEFNEKIIYLGKTPSKAIQSKLFEPEVSTEKHQYSKNVKRYLIDDLDRSQLQSLDIVYLHFSQKVYFCLKRAKINTVNDILTYSRDELLQIKNFQQKSVNEIENVLKKIHLTLPN